MPPHLDKTLCYITCPRLHDPLSTKHISHHLLSAIPLVWHSRSSTTSIETAIRLGSLLAQVWSCGRGGWLRILHLTFPTYNTCYLQKNKRTGIYHWGTVKPLMPDLIFSGYPAQFDATIWILDWSLISPLDHAPGSSRCNGMKTGELIECICSSHAKKRKRIGVYHEWELVAMVAAWLAANM